MNKLDRVLRLAEAAKINANSTKVTVTGTFKGQPITLNVDLTSQNYDKNGEGSWDGKISAVLGDETETIKHGDKVEVVLQRDDGKIVVHGDDWKLTSGVNPPAPQKKDPKKDPKAQKELDL